MCAWRRNLRANMRDLSFTDLSTTLVPLWRAYSEEVLAWQGMDSALTQELYSAEELGRHMQRGLTNSLRAGHSFCILLGCHEAAVEIFLAQSQERGIDLPLLILESQPAVAKAFLQRLSPLPDNVHLLVDTSPWALFMLTGALGLRPERCTLFFASPPNRRQQSLEHWRKLFLGAVPKELTSCHESGPFAQQTLSVGAIVHPNEPHLEEFFAHIPSWVHEVVVVWDAESMPQTAQYSCSAPVRHFCRPLQGDFSAQRNAMLSHCTGDWVLYLDADERFSAQSWAALPSLMQREQSGGVLFQRQTFEKDAQHIRMAFGLWPDVQLRLFPREAQVCFEGRIHEKVLGLQGQRVLAPRFPILHYSHIYKSAEQLQERLAVFSAAGGIEHRLSAAYPHLPQAFFSHLQYPCLWHLPV